MKKDKLRLHVLEILLLVVLILALFVSNIFNRTVLALVLFVFAIVVKVTIKKKKITSIYKNQVAWLMLAFAIIYVIVFYMMGLYFGFYIAPTTFGIPTIIKFIIPFTVIIFASEIIRGTLIIQKGKLSKVLVFISMVLIDLIVYWGVYDVSNLEDVLTMLGFILFASIACNLLYNYLTVRYLSKGVIIYRLITILYVYFVSYIPNVYLFFRSFLRMLYPFIIYLVLEYTYSKTNYAVKYKDRAKSIISTSIMMIIMVLIIALISCQFKYGLLVIGSGSMTGSINMGDAIIYEKYDGKPIENGMVIVFRKKNIKVVHRVVKVENVNGEYHYYTKGDSNQKIDDEYVVKDEIIGTTKSRIMYIGYPSLWIRDIFS